MYTFGNVTISVPHSGSHRLYILELLTAGFSSNCTATYTVILCTVLKFEKLLSLTVTLIFYRIPNGMKVLIFVHNIQTEKVNGF